MKSSITQQIPPVGSGMSPLHTVPTLMAALAVLWLGTTPANGGEQPENAVKLRPIEDFLQAQGSDASAAPFNFIAWADPQAALLMPVDYAGLTSRWLYEQSGGTIAIDTQIEGTVIERPLADGRAEVTILCHTRNAIVVVVSLAGQRVSLLGHNPFELLAGAEPALGECFLKYVFINDAPGAPLPDLLNLQPENLIFDSLEATATGPLSEAFGVPEGTPGRAQMTQVGMWLRGSDQGALSDDFPVEHIKLQVLPH